MCRLVCTVTAVELCHSHRVTGEVLDHEEREDRKETQENLDHLDRW